MAILNARTVTIKYFAWVRDKVGRSQEDIELDPALATVADLVAWLRTRGDEWQDAFAVTGVVRAAVDRVHAKPDVSIVSAREIAFFPPVTGG